MIKKEGEKWVLYSKDGSKVLGTFDSEEEAIKREKQVGYFKNKKKSEVKKSDSMKEEDEEPEEPKPEEDASEDPAGGCTCPKCGGSSERGDAESCSAIECPECDVTMVDKEDESEEEEPEVVEERLAESAVGILEITDIREGGDPRGPLEMDVAIIRPGFGNSKDGHYYPKEMLAKHSHMFRGIKMFETDHRDEEKSTRTWVSTIVDVPGILEDGSLRGRVVVHDPNFAERARNLKKAGLLHLLPNSIYASGTARDGEAEGKRAKIVEAITRVHSVDWVTAAGAGGHAIDLLESEQGKHLKDGEVAIEETTTQTLERNRVEVLLSEAGVADPYLTVLAKRTYTNEDEVREAALDMKTALREAGAGTVFGLGAGRVPARSEPQDRVMAEAGILKRYGIGGK